LAAISASTGLMEFGDDAANLVPVGVVKSPTVPAGTLTGDGTVEAVAKCGQCIKSVAVTGASAITDIFKQVWCTDGQTLTLTRQTAAPIGFVKKWISATLCDVQLYDIPMALAMSMMATKEDILLCSVGTNAMQGSTLMTLHTRTVYFKGQITAYWALPNAYDDAAVAGAQNVDLFIDDVSMKTTGGVNPAGLALAYTSCDAIGDMGTVISSSAILANDTDTFSSGSTLALKVRASGTGFTADVLAGFDIFATVVRLPGA
jgi:hypothetical protein